MASQTWSRGLHFYKEAKRLLDLEEGKLTVSFVEGLGVFYVWYVSYSGFSVDNDIEIFPPAPV